MECDQQCGSLTLVKKGGGCVAESMVVGGEGDQSRMELTNDDIRWQLVAPINLAALWFLRVKCQGRVLASAVVDLRL